MDTTENGPLRNQEMAAVLFNIATILRVQGHPNPYRIAAYERGARALMGLSEPVVDLLKNDAALPFRRRQRIGTRLRAKIREMADNGALEQYRHMVADLPPQIVELMRVPGIGPRRAGYVRQALGVESASQLILAARDGRLRSLRGFGPKRVGEIAALALPEGDSTIAAHIAPAWRQARLFDLPKAA